MRHPDTSMQHRGWAKQIKSADQLQAEPSCCWSEETRRRERGGVLTVSSGGRGGVVVRAQKGTRGDWGDHAWSVECGIRWCLVKAWGSIICDTFMQEGYTRAAASGDTASSQEEMTEHRHKSAPAKSINKHLLWLVAKPGTDSLTFSTSSTLKGAICHIQQNFALCRAIRHLQWQVYQPCMNSLFAN